MGLRIKKPHERNHSSLLPTIDSQRSNKEILDLIPSEQKLKLMNLQRFSFLQKMRRNSQLDMSNQKAVRLEREESVKRFVEVQEKYDSEMYRKYFSKDVNQIKIKRKSHMIMDNTRNNKERSKTIN